MADGLRTMRRARSASRARWLAAWLALALCAGRAAGAVALPDPDPLEAEVESLETYAELPLGSLRFAGTHNSYHLRPRFLGLPFLPFAVSKKHRYAHPPIPEQLEGTPDGAPAVRQLEIDVHMRRHDDELRVFHLPWIDNRSTCKTLTRCLEQVKAWSDARDGMHAPILVWIEPKDDTPLDRWLTLGYYERVDPMKIEQVILDVFPREQLLVPDDVRRGADTLPDALALYGWPSLAETRGRVLFALLDEDGHRASYLAESPRPNLEGRVMFVRSTSPDEPFAATFKINSAVPTLRDMQEFGREMIADPQLALLQVYPEPEKPQEPPSAFSIWWKNLWESARIAAGEGAVGDDGAADDAVADGAGESGDGGNVDSPQTVDDEPVVQEADVQELDVQEKDIESQAKPPAVDVARQVRRELEHVHTETRAEARERHRMAVAELEEHLRYDDAPASEELALVLENVRRSREYREVFLEKLRTFLSANERALILGLARRGFLVTTTADDPLENAARNRERAISALLSAAQFISSDTLRPQKKGGFVFEFPGDPILCNTLVDAEGCETAIGGH